MYILCYSADKGIFHIADCWFNLVFEAFFVFFCYVDSHFESNSALGE